MKDTDLYFDCAATVAPYEDVLKVFNDVSIKYFANSASNHALGFESSAMLEKARGQIAKYLLVNTDEVFFTSCATEGNNLAIKGIAYRCKGWAKRIITTKAEHPSVMNVFKELEKEGFDVVYLNYDQEGKLDINQLETALDDHTSLVSIMYVNNEIGTIFPIDDLYKLVKTKSKAIFHVDATQGIGKEKTPTSYDLMTLSGHKIGGIKGSGVLVKKKNVELDPQILGGEQEKGYRAGTSALGLDCSLATALRITLKSQDQRRNNVIQFKKYLSEKLKEIDEIVITSPECSTPFILSFALTKHKGSVIAEALSNEHIYVSTKSACSSREAGYSYVLYNAGFSETIAYNGIRLSFSGYETIEQADRFITTLKHILETIKENNI